jgi:type IX secretion system PorP/SprF family membrane protein
MKILIFFALFIPVGLINAQQIGFTESYPINQLGYNAALAAQNGNASFTALGQYGKNGEPGSMKNYYMAFEAPIGNSMGAAIQFSNYSHLLINNKAVSFSFSKHLKLDEKSSLSVGINGGVANSEYDFESDYGLSIIAEADKSATSAIPNKTKFSPINTFSESQYLLGAGIFFNTNSWHLGLSIPNILKNEVPKDLSTKELVALERPAFISIEKDFKLSQKWQITAGSLYRFSNNEYQKGLDLNTAIWFNKKYSIGLWQQRLGAKSFGENKPLLAITEVVINKVRLAYSFNLTNNSANYTNIKQQILLRLDIDYLKKKPKDNAASLLKNKL